MIIIIIITEHCFSRVDQISKINPLMIEKKFAKLNKHLKNTTDNFHVPWV